MASPENMLAQAGTRLYLMHLPKLLTDLAYQRVRSACARGGRGGGKGVGGGRESGARDLAAPWCLSRKGRRGECEVPNAWCGSSHFIKPLTCKSVSAGTPGARASWPAHWVSCGGARAPVVPAAARLLVKASTRAWPASQVLRGFGEFGRIELEPAPDIRQLLRIARLQEVRVGGCAWGRARLPNSTMSTSSRGLAAASSGRSHPAGCTVGLGEGGGDGRHHAPLDPMVKNVAFPNPPSLQEHAIGDDAQECEQLVQQAAMLADYFALDITPGGLGFAGCGGFGGACVPHSPTGPTLGEALLLGRHAHR